MTFAGRCHDVPDDRTVVERPDMGWQNSRRRSGSRSGGRAIRAPHSSVMLLSFQLESPNERVWLGARKPGSRYRSAATAALSRERAVAGRNPRLSRAADDQSGSSVPGASSAASATTTAAHGLADPALKLPVFSADVSPSVGHGIVINSPAPPTNALFGPVADQYAPVARNLVGDGLADAPRCVVLQ